MRVSRASETGEEAVGTMREGKLEQKHLLFGVDGSPNNYDLNTGYTGSGGWRTPRHRHDFDQIRYVVEGRLPYSETDYLEQGWVGYFPESVHYGPQEREEGLRTLVLQAGGASGNGYLSVAQREATNAELNKKGVFKKGLYHYTDENGVEQTLDGSQAIFEHATGRKLEFATPRYTDVIAMNPEAYDWIQQGESGVWDKWLGNFTERNLRLGFVRLDAGATYGAGQFSSIEILFQLNGNVLVGGEKYGAETGYEFLANEGPVAIEAVEPTEFFRAVLHTF
ncbi:hypothetical protein CH278_14695 [Rhodococcus sp. 05-2254-5]|uniref:hypothetical protein n=1 Tax=Nocardiaceae TaxID=85025 RepID=UPI0005640658|nr:MULTISPECIES: hypothetical protein [Rhodococcus]OZC88418.1 hypothetical protein CH282_07405 [Rhodococcus sp. 06-418-1B]OZE32084.1 hypothetical protein CH278_14695 [Rhodococcus sp. 05-2254-5]OZE59507.1 hypothetical protein CH269_06480 [Rhodococcus sp. 05-2254-1]OZE86331.1 hypothetical protein CH304_03140 [Rhodococcus sp. 15-649-1-2]